MESLWRDLRHALRGLIASPGFTLTVVLSIGLGIGANTTVFAWMDRVVRHPFPAIPDGGQLIALNVADVEGRVSGMAPIAYPVLEEWQRRVSSFAGIAPHAQARLTLRSTADAPGEALWVELVASNFFSTLGVGAATGRVFEANDEAQHAAVVVISHGTWQRRFGGTPGAIGRTLLFNGVPLTVIGIMPPRFGGVVTGLAFEAWVPLWQQPTLIPGGDWTRDRSVRRLQAVARLAPGVSLQQAQRTLNAAGVEVSRSFGESPLTGAGARWISDTQLGSLLGPLSLAMMAVTALVLLTASANVAGLLLARAANRRRQTAIQMAVGASRRHLVQQALVEGIVLAALGCVVGMWTAAATKNVLRWFVPRTALPVDVDVNLNWRVTAFAVLVTALTALLMALMPALSASRPDVVDALKSSSASGGTRRSRLRAALVVLQVAFSLVALTTAGLFLRSVAAAGRAPLGFADPQKVLLAATDLSFTRLEGEALATLVDRALGSVRALPGVENAALASIVPLSFGAPAGVQIKVEGYVPGANESMLVGRGIVSEGYFETLQMPLVEGRSLLPSDRAGSQRVVVVNDAFVARYWSGRSGVGRRIDLGDGWATVVGVVRNAAIDSLTEPPRPLAFQPWTQRMTNVLTLHVRTAADPKGLTESVRRALASVHQDLSALDPGTLTEHMLAATFVQSVGASVFTAFGLVALVIATIGLFGVVAQFVSERRRDIAVIVALGATPSAVIRAVMSPALRVTLLGLASGTVLAAVAAWLVRSQLIGIAPIDLAAIAAGNLILAAAALLSAVVPAWRAILIDPVDAIRQ